MQNRKPRLLLFENIKWIVLGLLLITLVFLYFIPRALMYPDYSPLGWIIFVIIFFIIPTLLFMVLIAFTKHAKLSTALAIGSALLVGPTFGLFQGYRENLELQKYGVWTNSVVIDRKHSIQKVGSWHWLLKCKYEADGKDYETLYHDDVDNLHPIGDTVKIIYSSQFPKIYSLDYEWKK